VHGQQSAQVHERLLAFVAVAGSDQFEQCLDLVVLGCQKDDDVVSITEDVRWLMNGLLAELADGAS